MDRQGCLSYYGAVEQRLKQGGMAVERRLTQFEKCGFDMREIAGAGEVGGNGADGLVGWLDTGAVGEDDDAGGHRNLGHWSRIGGKEKTNSNFG